MTLLWFYSWIISILEIIKWPILMGIFYGKGNRNVVSLHFFNVLYSIIIYRYHPWNCTSKLTIPMQLELFLLLDNSSLSQLRYCYDETMTNSMAGRKGFVWFLLTCHHASLKEARAGTETGLKLGVRTDAEATGRCCFLACST